MTPFEDMGAVFLDSDSDGDLDLYLVTNRIKPPPGLLQERFNVATGPDGEPILPDRYAQFAGLVKMPGGKYKQVASAQFDYLFRNDGNDDAGRPQFTDVSKAAGIWTTGYGLSATWWDFDSDGWIDLYVANDFYGADRLYRNNRDGSFSDVAPDVLPHTPWFSMGSDVADINNDGQLDFVALDMAATTHYKSKMAMGEMGVLRYLIEKALPRQVMRNCLYVSTGTGRYTECASLSGVSNSAWSWAPKLADFDNDGRVDLFISNGMARDFNNSDISFTAADQIGKSLWDHYENSPPKLEQNLAFRNKGDYAFEDVSKTWGLDHVGMSYGSAYGDLDGDGDADVVSCCEGRARSVNFHWSPANDPQRELLP